MDKERLLQNFKKELRSLLIASKHGLSLQELEREYRMLIGSPLPVKKLDYRTPLDMLHDMPDVVKIYTKADGTVNLSAVVNNETRGIADLVSKQKTTSRRRSVNRYRASRPLRNTELVRRGKMAPVLPASVKNELRELLSISPLPFSQLKSAFEERFGHSFQYTRYGFYSLLEVLRSISDMVQVTQTRAGSYLMLKTSESKGTFTGPPAKPNPNIWLFKQSHPVKLSQTCSVSKDESQYNKKPHSEKISLPLGASLPFISPTPLDKLFMVAEAQYYASSSTFEVNVHKKVPFAAADSTMKTNVHVGAGDCIKEKQIPFDAGDCNVENKLPFAAADCEMELPFKAEDRNMGENVNFVAGDCNKKKYISFDARDCNMVQSPLSTAIITADTPEPGKYYNPGKKLDKNLKLTLSMQKAGSVINPELRQDIKHVVQKYPEGLSISKLPLLYKEHTGKCLPFRDLGFMSVLDLVGSLGDMLHLESTVDGRDWLLFDIETKGASSETESKMMHIDNISMWDSSAKESETPKPLMIKVSPAEGNQLWRPLHPLSGTKQDIPPDVVREQKLHSLPPMKRGCIIGVFVENVISPSEFYIRCYSKDTSQKLEDMMIQMRRCYSNEYVSDRYAVPDEYVSVGEIYAVCVAGDVWWYRVIVHSIISSEEVQVYYPDFGNVAVLKRCWLRFLKSCYMKLPAQALPASLAAVNPLENQWSTEAIRIFQNFCAQGPLVGVMLQYVLDHLYLLLCDTSTDNDVYLHQLLINSKVGNKAEETEFYKDPPTRNVFLQYLTPSGQQLQEELTEMSMTSETSVVDFQDNKEPATQIKEEREFEMPCLEAVPSGDDVWDESWSLLGGAVSPRCKVKPSIDNTDENQFEKSSPKPVNDCGPNTDVDCLSRPLEEFYISIIKSENSVKTSGDFNSPPSKQCLSDITPRPTIDHSLPVTTEESQPLEKQNNIVCPESLCDEPTAKGANPLLGFQKFQFRRSATTAALGPAARLAASPGNLLHWGAD